MAKKLQLPIHEKLVDQNGKPTRALTMFFNDLLKEIEDLKARVKELEEASP